ncbi:MAG: polyphenol oxidase family protein [Ornithinimicrobium sp.]
MFLARERVGGGPDARFDIEWAVTDRFGSAVGGTNPFTLGGRHPAHAEVIAANRAELARELGLSPSGLRFMRQVHGCDVAIVHGPSRDVADDPTCDAMVTSDPSIALAVLVADCTPILLWDAAAGWVGAVHAGRAGFVGGAVASCVARLRGDGANDLHALVGPSICGRCYEVPAKMREQASTVQRSAYAMSWTGTPAIDVAAGVIAQLRDLTVPVCWLPGCTRESDELFSHRANAHAGRFAAVVRLHERGEAKR